MYSLIPITVNDDSASEENIIYTIESGGYRMFHVFEKDLAERIVKLLNNAETYEKLVHSIIDSASQKDLLELVKGLL